MGGPGWVWVWVRLGVGAHAAARAAAHASPRFRDRSVTAASSSRATGRASWRAATGRAGIGGPLPCLWAAAPPDSAGRGSASSEPSDPPLRRPNAPGRARAARPRSRPGAGPLDAAILMMDRIGEGPGRSLVSGFEMLGRPGQAGPGPIGRGREAAALDLPPWPACARALHPNCSLSLRSESIRVAVAFR